MILGFGCDGQDFYFDAFAWGSAGNVAISSSQTIKAAPTTITAGQSSVITGVTTAHYVDGTPVDLEVKPYGSSSWRKAAPVLAPETTWALRKSVALLKQASYRWHFLGTESGAESFSPVTTVKVKTALNATVVDRTLRRGQNLVVTGRTKPAKPGSIVKLWRKTASGPIVLARSRVRSDGTYKVAYPVNRAGTWTVYTTIPAVSGNLAGRSVNRSASVS